MGGKTHIRYLDICISLIEGKFQKAHFNWNKFSIRDKRDFAIQMVMLLRKVKT